MRRQDADALSTSPKTGVPLAHKHLTPNYTLRSLIDATRPQAGAPGSHGGYSQQCSTVPPAAPAIWECQTDRGWLAYDAQDAAALERAWAAASTAGGQASVRVAVRGGRNVVDLAGMTQSLSGGGGKARAVRRHVVASQASMGTAGIQVWECCTDSGWVTYDVQDAAALERAWAAASTAGGQASVRVAVRGGRNVVDLAGMTQSLSGGGGKARAVSRRPVSVVNTGFGSVVF